MTEINEEKTAAASYILTFYQEIATLTSFYAQYENFMIYLAKKYGSSAEEQSTDQEKKNITNLCDNIRYYTLITHIKYSSIIIKTKEDPDEELSKLHDKIKSTFVIKRDDVKEYVTRINAVLMNTVIKNLLENANDLMNKLYKDNTENAKP